MDVTLQLPRELWAVGRVFRPAYDGRARPATQHRAVSAATT